MSLPFSWNKKKQFINNEIQRNYCSISCYSFRHLIFLWFLELLSSAFNRIRIISRHYKEHVYFRVCDFAEEHTEMVYWHVWSRHQFDTRMNNKMNKGAIICWIFSQTANNIKYLEIWRKLMLIWDQQYIIFVYATNNCFKSK